MKLVLKHESGAVRIRCIVIVAISETQEKQTTEDRYSDGYLALKGKSVPNSHSKR